MMVDDQNIVSVIQHIVERKQTKNLIPYIQVNEQDSVDEVRCAESIKVVKHMLVTGGFGEQSSQIIYHMRHGKYPLTKSEIRELATAYMDLELVQNTNMIVRKTAQLQFSKIISSFLDRHTCMQNVNNVVAWKYNSDVQHQMTARLLNVVNPDVTHAQSLNTSTSEAQSVCVHGREATTPCTKKSTTKGQQKVEEMAS